MEKIIVERGFDDKFADYKQKWYEKYEKIEKSCKLHSVSEIVER